MTQNKPHEDGERIRLRDRVESLRAREADTPAARPHGEDEIHLIARSKNAPEIEVPWNIRVMAAWSWRALLIAAVAIVIGALLVQLQMIVIPALIAVILTVALEPASGFLRKKLRFPRALAAVTTVVVFIAAVLALMVFAGRQIGMGFVRLRDQAIAGFEALLDWAADGPFNIQQDQLEAWWNELQSVVQENLGTLASGAVSATSSLVNIGAGIFLVIFMGVFFLMDGRKIWVWFIRLLPTTWRVPTHEASIRSYFTLSGYVRAQVLVALVDAVGIAGGAFFLGVQLWLPIGVLVFLFSFIPMVGAFLSGAIACLVALVDRGFATAVILLIVVLAVQQIESNLLQPFIMGSTVSLHPVAVLLGVAAGTYIAGIAGAVFAVPLMAVVNTFLLYLSGHDKYPRLATDADRPGGPPGTLGDQIRASYGYPAAESTDGSRDEDFVHASKDELQIARDIANVIDEDEAAELDALESRMDTGDEGAVPEQPESPHAATPGHSESAGSGGRRLWDRLRRKPRTTSS
ncbi:MAG TPA: AI-2E family transporter [Actinomycetaceae bacterium]|nr:AI-2E family transporter [Actinomycetaceae bacterium]